MANNNEILLNSNIVRLLNSLYQVQESLKTVTGEFYTKLGYKPGDRIKFPEDFKLTVYLLRKAGADIVAHLINNFDLSGLMEQDYRMIAQFKKYALTKITGNKSFDRWFNTGDKQFILSHVAEVKDISELLKGRGQVFGTQLKELGGRIVIKPLSQGVVSTCSLRQVQGLIDFNEYLDDLRICGENIQFDIEESDTIRDIYDSLYSMSEEQIASVVDSFQKGLISNEHIVSVIQVFQTAGLAFRKTNSSDNWRLAVSFSAVERNYTTKTVQLPDLGTLTYFIKI